MTKARVIAIALGPLLTLLLLLLPAPAALTPEAWRLLALGSWMILWWTTEAAPVAVTALLPIALMPLLGIAPQKAVASSYGHPLIFLFLGGFLIATAMQRWGLHRRIALNIVRTVGTSAQAMIAGFMLATAFLSMWISNTATTVMMFAVGLSVIEFVDNQLAAKNASRTFGVALMLAIAYSASIGGIGTLIGTPPNTLMASFLADSYGIHIDFASWMLVGIPIVLVMLPITWLLLCKWVFPLGDIDLGGGGDLIHDELRAMGPMSRGERVVLAVFVITALAWITRPWLVHYSGLAITDTTIALLAATSLFVLPGSVAKGQFCIEWQDTRQLPWGVLILFGGGLALAAAVKDTGLAAAIGDGVTNMQGLSLGLLVLITAAVVLFLTEVSSNTATAATFLPLLGAVAVGLGASPLVLAIPAALAASMAFMMPVATPPNAIVFSYQQLKISDMVRAGFCLNIIAVAVVYLAMMWLVPRVFDIGQL